jgi:hypothetical protein
MSIVIFLYGFFLIAAFNYGRKLTEQNALIIPGLITGLGCMLLAPWVYLRNDTAFLIIILLFAAIAAYQLYYILKYHFFPAKTGLFIHTSIFIMLMAAWLL